VTIPQRKTTASPICVSSPYDTSRHASSCTATVVLVVCDDSRLAFEATMFLQSAHIILHEEFLKVTSIKNNYSIKIHSNFDKIAYIK